MISIKNYAFKIILGHTIITQVGQFVKKKADARYFYPASAHGGGAILRAISFSPPILFTYLCIGLLGADEFPQFKAEVEGVGSAV